MHPAQKAGFLHLVAEHSPNHHAPCGRPKPQKHEVWPHMVAACVQIQQDTRPWSLVSAYSVSGQDPSSGTAGRTENQPHMQQWLPPK
jgi:hypothetical protein